MADQKLDIPKHVGFIVDGNRRWAKQHGLPTYEGHLAGVNALKEVGFASLDAGIEYLSMYIFSTENWKRSKDEISGLMKLILKLFTTDAKLFHDNQVRLKVLGMRDGLDDKILKAMDKLVEDTKDYKKGTFALCLNYGGQQEIVDAVKKIVQLGVNPEDIDENLIATSLYEPEVPPMDIMVRTSGEKRLSNFMLWRAAYSEFMFLEKMWPEMTKDDVTAIIEEYSRRHRRFGG